MGENRNKQIKDFLQKEQIKTYSQLSKFLYEYNNYPKDKNFFEGKCSDYASSVLYLCGLFNRGKVAKLKEFFADMIWTQNNTGIPFGFTQTSTAQEFQKETEDLSDVKELEDMLRNVGVVHIASINLGEDTSENVKSKLEEGFKNYEDIKNHPAYNFIYAELEKEFNKTLIENATSTVSFVPQEYWKQYMDKIENEFQEEEIKNKLWSNFMDEVKKQKHLIKIPIGKDSCETEFNKTIPKQFQDYNSSMAPDVEDHIQKTGVKHNSGKLPMELDFYFIKQMAERMAANKQNGKYEKWNWKSSMNAEEIREAIFRHCLEIMEENYEDDGRVYGHIEAIATNCMILNYILRNKN